MNEISDSKIMESGRRWVGPKIKIIKGLNCLDLPTYLSYKVNKRKIHRLFVVFIIFKTFIVEEQKIILEKSPFAKA